MTIRTATFDDLDQVVELARLYHEEAYQWIPFDAAHARETIRKGSIDTVDGICLLLIGDDGSAVGLLAGVAMPLPSAPARIGVEMIWYVRPEHRGRGLSLLEDFEAWANWRGCIAVSSSRRYFDDQRRDDAMHRLYDRSGYRLQELGYVKVL